MPSLRLFGGVVLDGLAGPLTGRAVQRRRLAILVVLAGSPGRAASRDRLLSLLWPESATDSARHLLSGAVYELRKALGEATIVSAGDDLRLNLAHLRVDVADFDAHLADGDLEHAVELYAGPFAEGFHVSGAPALDDWLEATRAALRQRYHAAAVSLAESRTAARDGAGAVLTWRRLVGDDPYATRHVVGLMRALVAVGNRAAALREASAHAELLRLELGVEPDAEVIELAEQLRHPLGAPAAPAPLQAPAGPEHGVPREAQGSAAGRPRRLAPRALRTAGALALVGAAVLGGSWWMARYAPARPPVVESRIAVLPFSVRASAEFAYLGEGMTDLLSTGLDGAGELRTVKPEVLLDLVRRTGDALDPERALALAERLGAGACVLGSVVEMERRLYLRAVLYRRQHGLEPVAEATVSGDASNLFELVDALARELLARQSNEPVDRIASVGARTTHSLPALKEYLSGERELRAGRFVAAADAFARAAAHDSTFALAHYRLSLASLWADRSETFPADADRRAWRHAGRLSDRDRRLLQAYLAWRAGNADVAEHLYREIVAAYPDDIEAWHQLGETLFHYNPLRGKPLGEARYAFEQVLALDPAHRGAAWHLAQLAAKEGRSREFHRLLERLRRQAPDNEEALEIRALAALYRRDRRAESKLEAELAAADVNTLSRLLWRSAVYLGDLDGARRLAGSLTRPERFAYPRMVGHAHLVYLQLAGGRQRAARAELAALAALDTDGWLAMKARVFASAAPLLPTDTAALAALRDDIAAWKEARARHRPHQLYLLGLVSDALGDTAAVRVHAVERDRVLASLEPLDTLADPLALGPDAGEHAYTGTLRALLAWRAGRAEEALRVLERSSAHRWYGLAISSPVHAQGFERFLRAELLHELGRHDEALRWYAGFGEHAVHDLIYLAPSHLRRARIHEQLGNRAAAREHYTAFLTLWRDADPELQPLLEHARGRLARLRGTGAGA